MNQPVLWLLLAIFGELVALLFLLFGILTLGFTLLSGAPLTGMETVTTASLMTLGLTFGIALAIQLLRSWKGKEEIPFPSIRIWMLSLAWIVVVGAGTAANLVPLLQIALLPPLHILAMSLPAFIMLAVVRQQMRGVKFSWRESIASLTGGGPLATGASLVVELILLLIVGLIAGVFLLQTPDLLEQIRELAQTLQETGQELPMGEVAEILLRPSIVISTIALTSIPVPIIEEFLKTLVIGIAARWTQPRPPRAFLWGVASGAGFALVENLLNGGMMGVEGWTTLALSRFAATTLHCATGGIMGWAWGQFWTQKRRLRLPLAYLLAVIVHGVWNALATGASLLGLRVIVNEGDGIGTLLTSGAVLLLAGTLFTLTIFFLVLLPVSGRWLASREAGEAEASTEKIEEGSDGSRLSEEPA